MWQRLPSRLFYFALILASLSTQCKVFGQDDIPKTPLGQHGFADSNGVKIHYVTAGEGPLLVMIHGFPDYWYSWRNQIPELSKHFQVVAIDQRGYNRSDQPSRMEDYAMPLLLSDVKAVIEHFDQSSATVVGHDWGGAVAWYFAISYPQMVDRLVVLNTPHPNGLSRELSTNKQQQANSQYARDFQKPDAAEKMTPKILANIVGDSESRDQYVEAFQRSSIEGMLNYYKANYPKGGAEQQQSLPKVRCPVLLIYGLQDQALLPAGLNDTWEWLEKDLTLVALPDAGHFVQHEKPKRVTREMVKWLIESEPKE